MNQVKERGVDDAHIVFINRLENAEHFCKIFCVHVIIALEVM